MSEPISQAARDAARHMADMHFHGNISSWDTTKSAEIIQRVVTDTTAPLAARCAELERERDEQMQKAAKYWADWQHSINKATVLREQVEALTKERDEARGKWVDAIEETGRRMTKELYEIVFAGEPPQEREVRWKWAIMEVRALYEQLSSARAEKASLADKLLQLRDNTADRGKRLAYEHAASLVRAAMPSVNQPRDRGRMKI